MKTLSLALLLVLGYLQYSLWYGKNNVHDYINLNAEINDQQVKNDVLKQRNAKMSAEIRALTEEQEAVEERARTELDMIKQDERFYRIIVDK